jgi:hypothetical protein
MVIAASGLVSVARMPQAFCCVDRIEDAHAGDQQALDDDQGEESGDAGMDERETEWEE